MQKRAAAADGMPPRETFVQVIGKRRGGSTGNAA
jgi:hypothetical protein